MRPLPLFPDRQVPRELDRQANATGKRRRSRNGHPGRRHGARSRSCKGSQAMKSPDNSRTGSDHCYTCRWSGPEPVARLQ
jgi:hypothetical protein